MANIVQLQRAISRKLYVQMDRTKGTCISVLEAILNRIRVQMNDQDGWSGVKFARDF